MFTWAVVNPDYTVKRIERATLDVPKTRRHERWVRVEQGTKWKEGLVYNPTTGELENG